MISHEYVTSSILEHSKQSPVPGLAQMCWPGALAVIIGLCILQTFRLALLIPELSKIISKIQKKCGLHKNQFQCQSPTVAPTLLLMKRTRCCFRFFYDMNFMIFLRFHVPKPKNLVFCVTLCYGDQKPTFCSNKSHTSII